jgi:hypothetical protein
MAMLVPTWLLRNVTTTNLTVKADPAPTSTIYPSSASQVTLKPGVNVEIERARLEEEQILALQRKNLITMTPLVKSVIAPSPGSQFGSGSTT